MCNRVGKSNCLGYKNEISAVYVAITGLLDGALMVFITSLIIDSRRLACIVDVIQQRDIPPVPHPNGLHSHG